MRSNPAPASPIFRLGLAACLAWTALAPVSVVGAQDPAPIVTADDLGGLDFMTGRWWIPRGAPVLTQNPALADVVILEVLPIVGGNALRVREHTPVDGPADDAEVEGIIYWDPAEERLEFVAVGGRGEGQGRLFVGEYRVLADGRVERVYDVHYRTAADMPAEDWGGSRRRYREVYAPDGPDALTHSLEWWVGGEWRPFGQGRYRLERSRPRAP